jgi:NADH-quinone oxidoreductase subunit G
LLQALPKASIDEAAANAKTVVTLTGDLREELPILFLRLRESAVQKHHDIVEFTFGASGLRSVARLRFRCDRVKRTSWPSRSRTARSPRAWPLAKANLTKPGVSSVRPVRESSLWSVVLTSPKARWSSRVRSDNLREGFPAATFLPALRRANVNGALDMGLAPQLLPGRGFNATLRGRDTLAQLAALASGEQKAVLLLVADVLGNVVDVVLATKALDAALVVVVSGHGGATLAYADVVLPAAVQHERIGTVTNIEGRVTSVTEDRPARFGVARRRDCL